MCFSSREWRRRPAQETRRAGLAVVAWVGGFGDMFGVLFAIIFVPLYNYLGKVFAEKVTF